MKIFTIPDSSCFFGQLRPTGIAGDYFRTEWRGLAPQSFKSSRHLLIQGLTTRCFTDQIPLNPGGQSRTRQVTGTHDHDPTGRIRNAPCFWVKSAGVPMEFFELHQPGLKMPGQTAGMASNCHPSRKRPQGIGGSDAQVVPHKQADSRSGFISRKQSLADEIQTGRLGKGGHQFNFRGTRNPVGYAGP